ncbi:TPA: hypothetical protein ACH3X2_000953 [Trebouxia sp. C0005]
MPLKDFRPSLSNRTKSTLMDEDSDRVGKRLAAEQDNLFRKVNYAILNVSADVHWHGTPLLTLVTQIVREALAKIEVAGALLCKTHRSRIRLLA